MKGETIARFYRELRGQSSSWPDLGLAGPMNNTAEVQKGNNIFVMARQWWSGPVFVCPMGYALRAVSLERTISSDDLPDEAFRIVSFDGGKMILS